MKIWLDEYGHEVIGNELNAIDEETGFPVKLRVMRRLSDSRILLRFGGQVYSLKKYSGISLARRSWAAGNKANDSLTDSTIETIFAKRLIPESEILKNREMNREIVEAMKETGISLDSMRKFETNRWEMVKEDPFQLVRFVTMVSKKFFANQKNLIDWMFMRKSITFPINSRAQAWVALRLAAIWNEINWENVHPELIREDNDTHGKNTKPVCKCQKKPGK